MRSRGAVRPPFIEARSGRLRAVRRYSLGGQSAPPSLKQFAAVVATISACLSRGAVRPPFIEAWTGPLAPLLR